MGANATASSSARVTTVVLRRAATAADRHTVDQRLDGRRTGLAIDGEGQRLCRPARPGQPGEGLRRRQARQRTIGRAGGRALLGKWTPDGLRFINGLAVDAEGKLWVAEADGAPKRVSVWNASDGTLVQEFFGPSGYGALGGAINPHDPNVMVGQGCEWRLDPKTGQAACLGVITRDGMEQRAVRHRRQRPALPGASRRLGVRPSDRCTSTSASATRDYKLRRRFLCR